MVFESVTLDGVMQAPGRPDEDTRGGFEHGGWAAPYADEVMFVMAQQGMASTGGILLGGRTYEDFFGFWLQQTDNPRGCSLASSTPTRQAIRWNGTWPTWLLRQQRRPARSQGRDVSGVSPQTLARPPRTLAIGPTWMAMA